MILDQENILSDEQAVTATAASTNYIDLQNAVNRIGAPLELFITVDETFDSAGDAATLTIAIREDATDAMAGSPAAIVSSAVIAEADLVAGAKIPLPQLPKKTLQYIDAYYTVGTEDFTAGKLTLGMVKDEQTNGHAAMVEQKAAGVI